MNPYSPVIFNFMFKNGDIVYHERYGIGKILCPADCVSRIKFELKNEDLSVDNIAIIKNDDLKLLDEIIEVGSRVKNIRFGCGTVLRIHTSHKTTHFLVEFDKEHLLLYRILHRVWTKEDISLKTLKRNRLWCVPKYDEFNGFEVIDPLDGIRISSTIVLKDMYDNVRQDLPGREKEFLSDVRKQDIDLLDRILTSKTKDWFINKKIQGERKNE